MINEHHKIETAGNATDEKSYLQLLYTRLVQLKENDKTVSFVIQKPQKTGFLIKVGGLYGYIDYTHFAWSYSKVNIWKTIAPLVVGHKFYGKINKLSNSPIYVGLCGKAHIF